MKNDADLMPWVKSIINHLYWASLTCGGDPQLLKKKWISCIYHIPNKHTWNGYKMVQCEHGPIFDDNTTA